MKIIPTSPRTSLPGFHQMALQGRSNSEKPFVETLGRLVLGHVVIIFMILALSHVLRTLLRFSLGKYFGVFFS